MNATLRTICLSGLALTAVVLTGCESGPGRCVGAEAAAASVQGKKVLLNLDSNGVAIQGYDPVAYFTDKKAVPGNPAIRSSYDGAVYYFATAEHQRMFDANPGAYAPQFGGYCAYAASIDTISPIDPQFWEVVDGRLLLQHNQKAWDLWHKEPAPNLVKADKNWPGIVERNGSEARTLVNIDETGLALEGYDPVSYFTDPKPVKGDAALARTYNGATYYFASVEHKNIFEKEPAKYVPAFGGFCGYAASINKVSPVNVTIFQIINDRLVLQHTPKAFELFNEDPQGALTRADANWPGLTEKNGH